MPIRSGAAKGTSGHHHHGPSNPMSTAATMSAIGSQV
jgi:hypothetical protein